MEEDQDDDNSLNRPAPSRPATIWQPAQQAPQPGPPISAVAAPTPGYGGQLPESAPRLATQTEIGQPATAEITTRLFDYYTEPSGVERPTTTGVYGRYEEDPQPYAGEASSEETQYSDTKPEEQPSDEGQLYEDGDSSEEEAETPPSRPVTPEPDPYYSDLLFSLIRPMPSVPRS